MGIKITDLTALATAPNTADVIAIVDVSDTTQALSGTTKKITIADLGFLSSGDNITELTNNAGYITSSDFSNGGELAGANRDLGNTDAFALSFITNGVGRINIEAGGDVGIGTSTPTEKLDVVGNIISSGRINAGGVTSNNGVLNVRSAGNSFATITSYWQNSDLDEMLQIRDDNSWIVGNTKRGAVGIVGTGGSNFSSRPNATLHIRGSEGGRALLVDDGNVGIGTTTPASKLTVNGNTDSTTYSVNGTAGANFSGAVTNITVVDGIVTAVS